MKRYGWVIGIKPELIETYKYHHANPWPEVVERITDSNIRNFSIFLKDDRLFLYYEYHGTDHEADTARIAAHEKTKEWWAVVGPCQQPLETRKPGEWWAEMEEVYHQD
jgi:L-rhamnose mutarotase